MFFLPHIHNTPAGTFCTDEHWMKKKRKKKQQPKSCDDMTMKCDSWQFVSCQSKFIFALIGWTCSDGPVELILRIYKIFHFPPLKSIFCSERRATIRSWQMLPIIDSSISIDYLTPSQFCKISGSNRIKTSYLYLYIYLWWLDYSKIRHRAHFFCLREFSFCMGRTGAV